MRLSLGHFLPQRTYVLHSFWWLRFLSRCYIEYIGPCALYGDPVYEIARMNFWAEAMAAGHIDWLSALIEYRRTHDLLPLENLPQRLHCYELYHGLWHARHCALTNQLRGIDWALHKAEVATAALRATIRSS